MHVHLFFPCLSFWAIQVQMLFQIEFDALMFVIGMAWTVIIPVEAHVQSLPFVFDFILLCLTFAFSSRAFIGLMPAGAAVSTALSFLWSSREALAEEYGVND